MEKVIYNQIADEKYLGVITILDYETSVRNCLSNITVCTQNRSERKVIVDLALKVGINKYRFVACNITDDGEIIWNSNTYISLCDHTVKLANLFICQKSEILSNSMLPNYTKEALYKNS